MHGNVKSFLVCLIVFERSDHCTRLQCTVLNRRCYNFWTFCAYYTWMTSPTYYQRFEYTYPCITANGAKIYNQFTNTVCCRCRTRGRRHRHHRRWCILYICEKRGRARFFPFLRNISKCQLMWHSFAASAFFLNKSHSCQTEHDENALKVI